MKSIKYIALILLITNICAAEDPFVFDPCSTEVFTYKRESDSEETKGTRIFEAKSANDCKDRKNGEYTYDSYEYDFDNNKYKLKTKGTTKTFYTHCCYITYDRIKEFELGRDSKNEETGIEGYCTGLTDSQYEHIKDYINYLTFKVDDDDYALNKVKIDCKSKYIQLGLLSLLLLILF